MQDTCRIRFRQKIGRVPCDDGQKHMSREMIIKKILDRCSEMSVSRDSIRQTLYVLKVACAEGPSESAGLEIIHQSD